jgi:hypothetical protein
MQAEGKHKALDQSSKARADPDATFGRDFDEADEEIGEGSVIGPRS